MRVSWIVLIDFLWSNVFNFTLEGTMMQSLEERLPGVIKIYGEDSPVVKIYRKQIAAEKSGQSFQQVYTTGSVARLPRKKE